MNDEDTPNKPTYIGRSSMKIKTVKVGDLIRLQPHCYSGATRGVLAVAEKTLFLVVEVYDGGVHGKEIINVILPNAPHCGKFIFHTDDIELALSVQP